MGSFVTARAAKPQTGLQGGQQQVGQLGQTSYANPTVPTQSIGWQPAVQQMQSFQPVQQQQQAAPAAGSGQAAPKQANPALADQIMKALSGQGGFGMGMSAGQSNQAAPQPATVNVSSQADPGMQAFLGQLQTRLQQQQAGENAPVSWSAQRATDQANRDIYGMAAGAKKQKAEELAARGLRSDVGAGKGQLRAIDEAAQTRSARSASDIALAREKEQDQLNLQRAQQVNSLYGQYGNVAQVPFQQQLEGNRLALSAAQGAEDSAIRRAQLQSQNAMNQQSLDNQKLGMWMSLLNMV